MRDCRSGQNRAPGVGNSVRNALTRGAIAPADCPSANAWLLCHWPWVNASRGGRRTIAKSRGSSDRASSFPRRRESGDVAGKKRCWLIALLDSRLRGKDVMVARLLPSTSLQALRYWKRLCNRPGGGRRRSSIPGLARGGGCGILQERRGAILPFVGTNPGTMADLT